MNKRPKPEKRFYRSWIRKEGFTTFEIVAGESDVFISIPTKYYSERLKNNLTEFLIDLRNQILEFSKKYPQFLTSLTPIKTPVMAPSIVTYMAKASEKVGVGPMAGVAGAINYFLGEELIETGIDEFFIENGGDIYLSSKTTSIVGLIFGVPELDGKLAIKLPPSTWSVCTSSSKIGHSLSLGQTQSATVLGKDPALTDCAATLLANSKSLKEIEKKSEQITGIEGILVLINGKFLIKNIQLLKLQHFS